MSTEDVTEPTEGQEPQEGVEEAKPQAPAFSPEDLAQLRSANAELREQLAEMRGAIDAMRHTPSPQPAAPPSSEPIVSDEEIDEAVSEGKGAGAKFRQLVDQAVKRATKQIKEAEIDPLRSYGTASLKELASVSIRSNKHYERYKKEIEAVASQVPAENLGNPQTWQLIYNNVVGAHADEIAAEAAEAAVRQRRDAGGEASLPGTGKSEAKAPPAPKARDFAGIEGESALRYKGVDEDELVKRMNIPGVTTWAEYVAMGERLEAENG